MAAVIGALFGLGTLAVNYGRDAGIAFEMDRGVPETVDGLYEVERAGDATFAWTRRSASLRLNGLDRRVEWSCTIRLRGARVDPSTLPAVTISVDGLVGAVHRTTNEYQDVQVTLPPKAGASGGVITLTSSDTFVPGPSDQRTLGVMLDRFACHPGGSRWVRPPPGGLRAAGIGGAAFAAAFSLAGAPALAVLAGTALLAIGQAVALGLGFAMFGGYPERAAWLALWIAGLLVAAVRGLGWARRRPLTSAATAVISIAAAVLYLKLLALLHPAKLPIDVVFHAHRLQWVLDGRFYFTQPMPSGVRFPYAIGLYVFAAPWSLLTGDYVLLLRIVVSAAEAAGAVLVYLLVARVWQDRTAGVIAATLFHFVPRTYEIVGNANMTNAFGQSVALAVLAAAVLWPLGRRDWRSAAGLTFLTAFALLSHISVFTTLGVILGCLALLYWWKGGQQLRHPAIAIVASLAVAALISVALYYGHFGEAYRSARRVRAASVSSSEPAQPPPAATSVALAGASLSPAERTTEAGRLTVTAIGWPILLLAIGGGVHRWRHGLNDRLGLAILALLFTFAAMTLAVVLAPVERSFQRYAAEFITRITLATYPAAVILAGAGAAAAWRAGWAGRVLATVLMMGAARVAYSCWIGWLA